MGQDRRQYLRVRTNLRALVKKVSKDTKTPSIRISSNELFRSDFDYKDMGIPEGLCLFLQYLDRKIDQILSLIGNALIEKGFEFSTDIVELGGGGLKCIIDKHSFQSGDKVELVLYLSHIPLYLISVLGKIVRIEKHMGKDLAVIEFEYVKERDQDAIVRFIFQEQRDQIRAKKEQNLIDEES